MNEKNTSQHLKIRVTGRVQGVGYRQHAKKGATLYGIYGFVRNEGDESVFIEAEGAPEQLDEFMKWCRLGPPLGYVNNVQIQTGELKFFKQFTIDY